MLNQLPTELLIQILARLPVKSLLRLRCVCKSWHSVIDDPDFINFHFNFSKNDENIQGYFLRLFGGSTKYTAFNKEFTQRVEFELPHDGPFEIIGSCNGLFCLTYEGNYFGYNICFWNPSIRKSLFLSDSCLLNLDSHPNLMFVIGFGFDCRNIDYKVVRILCSPVVSEVEVYTLGTGQWKKSAATAPCVKWNPSSSCTYLNGACHWIVDESEENDLASIVSFDLGCELFQELMLPYIYSDNTDLATGVYRESLSLAACIWGGCYSSFDRCDVWVMNEYGVLSSWAKLFSVKPQVSVTSLRDFGWDDKLLFEAFWGEIILYDPDNQQYKELGFCSETNVATNYMGSLVLLKEGINVLRHANSCN